MRYLLYMDFKCIYKLLILYFFLVVLGTVFVTPLLGFACILYFIRIEGALWRENIMMGLPEIYKGMPKGKMYATEKTLLCYGIAGIATGIWGGLSVAAGGVTEETLIWEYGAEIGLAGIALLVIGFIHVTWLKYALGNLGMSAIMHKVGSVSILMFVCIVIMGRIDIITNIMKKIFLFRKDTCLIIWILNMLLFAFSIVYGEKRMRNY